MPLDDRRIGRFDIGVPMVGNNPGLVRAIMGHVIVVHAETLYHLHAIRYTAICEDFAELPLGAEPPSYDIEVSEDEDAVTISFVKADY